MNKYRDKSDFEINCQVLETFEPDIKHMCLSHDEKSFYHCGFDGNGFYETTIPDYCNNPADAMPIVIENKITVAYDKLYETWCAHVGSVMSGDGGWDYSIEPVINYCDDNYYRAAMICFLMMKDAENEK
ncbi:phage protein NinX family protein [Morganella morganii]|uniref:phage protein NinX family protein n=1 Tax=Morganella morganii TaxID=582 RepID=UPI00301C9177